MAKSTKFITGKYEDLSLYSQIHVNFVYSGMFP